MPIPPTENPSAFRRALGLWFKKNARSLPWRKNRSPYHVVVSELMLQQTQVKTVLPYYVRWINVLPDWKTLAEARIGRVLKLWEGLGYYSRARNLHRMARIITRQYAGSFPEDPTQMRSLPGIGPYTAGAVASLAFGQSVPLIDGNVERVFARLFNLRGNIKSAPNQKKLWSLAQQMLPKRHAGSFNESLMELGALVCTPRSPQCPICPVRKFCTATNPESLPLRVRTSIIKLNITYALIRKRNKIWLIPPEAPGRWKGFHRLPEFDQTSMLPRRELGCHTFSITKYRIRGTVMRALWTHTPPTPGQWHDLTSLDSLALPTPVRKMIAFNQSS